ncbi:hypothetical protein E2C01_018973 [Portunus trituberculatus]|uniref:Uncharacterized protein n=1 Tax=Portunus trituberculatus TaxID=210409 RepID=A0A5B7DWG3_PORTR|nr:hypothetical protein [Portunus trituberculatus]
MGLATTTAAFLATITVAMPRTKATSLVMVLATITPVWLESMAQVVLLAALTIQLFLET